VRVGNENYGRRHYLGCGLDPGLAFGMLWIGTIKNPECTLRSGSTNWIHKNTYFCTEHLKFSFYSEKLEIQEIRQDSEKIRYQNFRLTDPNMGSGLLVVPILGISGARSGSGPDPRRWPQMPIQKKTELN
jgi:hypothetical protein